MILISLHFKSFPPRCVHSISRKGHALGSSKRCNTTRRKCNYHRGRYLLPGWPDPPHFSTKFVCQCVGLLTQQHNRSSCVLITKNCVPNRSDFLPQELFCDGVVILPAHHKSILLRGGVRSVKSRSRSRPGGGGIMHQGDRHSK